MMKSITNNNQNKYGIIAAVICILFNMNTLITSTHFANNMYAIISFVLIISLYSLYLVTGTGRPVIYTNSFVFITVCSILLGITAVTNRDTSNVLYLVILLEIFKAILLVQMIDFKGFAKVFVDTNLLFALISVIMFVACMVLPAVKNLAIHRTNLNTGQSIYSFLVYYYLPTASRRNTGFLSEPGDYQHYLNIALMLKLFVFRGQDRNLIDKWSPLILSIASLTTFSPVGMIFLGIIWVAYVLNEQINAKNSIKAAAICIASIVAILSSEFMVNGLLYSHDKLTGASTSSLAVRIISITSGFQVFLENPIFGNGITRGSEMMNNIFLNNGLHYNQTSTTSSFFAMFGLFFGWIFIWYYFKALYKILSNYVKPMVPILLLIGVAISINNERLIYELTYYIFVVYGVIGNIITDKYAGDGVKKSISDNT